MSQIHKTFFNHKEWVGDGRLLVKGDFVLFNGDFYKVDESHCTKENWIPSDCMFFSKCPARKIDIWSQPIIDNGYEFGDRVFYGGHIWESAYAGLNVWEPDTHQNITLWRKVI